MRPEIRASYLKSDVDALAHLDAGVERRVRERVPEVLRAAKENVGVGWLPVELDVRLTLAVEAEAGREGVHDWAKQGVLRAIESPLLGPIRAGLMRLGLTPHSALRRVPRGWTLVFRRCCTPEYAPSGDAAGELVLRACAPAFFVPAYLAGIGAAFEGIVEAAGGREAEVGLALDEPTRTARYGCRWRP